MAHAQRGALQARGGAHACKPTRGSTGAHRPSLRARPHTRGGTWRDACKHTERKHTEARASMHTYSFRPLSNKPLALSWQQQHLHYRHHHTTATSGHHNSPVSSTHWPTTGHHNSPASSTHWPTTGHHNSPASSTHWPTTPSRRHHRKHRHNTTGSAASMHRAAGHIWRLVGGPGRGSLKLPQTDIATRGRAWRRDQRPYGCPQIPSFHHAGLQLDKRRPLY